MNHEILFRGKRVDNGAWAENGSIQQTNYCGTYLWFEGRWIEIIPETHGEYTGLTDKNGKKIFEGDIIKTKKYGRDTGRSNVNDFDIFTVVYEPCMFCLVKEHRDINRCRKFVLEDDGYSKFEIIGNIHDNPELIIGGNENDG